MLSNMQGGGMGERPSQLAADVAAVPVEVGDRWLKMPPALRLF